jgi:hypothetical protein
LIHIIFVVKSLIAANFHQPRTKDRSEALSRRHLGRHNLCG